MKKARSMVGSRKHIRFKPDPIEIAVIDMDGKGSRFKATASGLILDEAYQGCGLVMVHIPQPAKGDLWKIKVGQLSPMKAEVVWAERLDDCTVKVGLRYLES